MISSPVAPAPATPPMPAFTPLADIESPVLQATIDSLAVHLAILNENGTIISVNAAWRSYARGNDFSGESYGIGANYLDVCARATGSNAEEAPLVLAGLTEVLRGERDEFYLEYPCHSPTEQRWYALRATRFWNCGSSENGPENGLESDEPTRVVVTHEDISARKLTEIRLREETEVTATLYRISTVVAGELDASKLVEAITQAAVELTGAHIGAFLPMPDSPVAPPHLFGAGVSQPEYALSPLDAGAMFGQGIELRVANVGADDRFALPGVPATFAAPYADPSGNGTENGARRDALRTPFGDGGAIASYLAMPIIARSGQWLGALFLAHPQPDCFSKTAGQIVRGLAGQAALSLENARLFEAAQREKAALATLEERYRLMTELIPQIVWITDAAGAHLYFNRRWYEFTGLSREQSLGDGWANPLHPDDIARADARWRRALDSGDPYEIEYRFRRHDGQYEWFLARALALRDESGRIVKWFGTCTNINEAKLAAAERAQVLESEAHARREAEDANRLKDEFLAVVSHELRTPLTPILGWLELLQGDPPREMREQAYDVIGRNTRAQTQIVNDLLDVSRITSGKLGLELRPLDLREVLRAAIETVEPTARVKGVILESALPARPAYSVGDPDRLQQVAWNLISNAVKFTPRGGQVTVELNRQDSCYVIEVRDSGAGIEPEFLPFVFERFRQADASSTRRNGGLGLGLSIVRYLVEQHGGGCEVESQGAGTGATFRARLPIAPLTSSDPEGALNAANASENEEIRAASAALQGIKILVVDDEPDAREVLQIVLERYGARIETAANASEGLRKFHDFRPDILLSDIGMPDENGYEFIARVRALSAQNGGLTPAVALTAYARAEDRAQALEAGFQNHLAKPVAPGQLVMTLSGLLK